MSKKNLCVLSSLVIGISLFFPYFSVSFFGTSISKSLIEGSDGIIILIIAVVALICSLMGRFIFSGILGAISLGIFFVENAAISSNLGDAGAIVQSMLQHGVGYYLLLIGSIMLILFSVLAQKEKV